MTNAGVVAACRAALLTACPAYYGDNVVDVDDAAACMAEREARILAHVYSGHPSEAQIRGALAAAQGGTDGWQLTTHPRGIR